MITERRPDVSPFSAIEFIANWLCGTPTVRKWAGQRPSILGGSNLAHLAALAGLRHSIGWRDLPAEGFE